MAKNIISYNVNGIRSALSKGLLDWVKDVSPDVLCLQETKAHPDQVPEKIRFEELGYEQHWHSAEKKGYSGVAVFTRQKPQKVVLGCGMDQYDREGRIIRLDFENWSLLNCYFPSGTSGEERQAFKMTFLSDFFDWVKELQETHPNLIIVGDYNIAHHPIDIHDPVGNKKSSGFLPEEREWMSHWFSNGFTDAFRSRHPEKVEYSWWSFRANARKNNKGWRIDYQSLSNSLADKILDAGHYNDAVHSDHCPVWLKIDL